MRQSGVRAGEDANAGSLPWWPERQKPRPAVSVQYFLWTLWEGKTRRGMGEVFRSSLRVTHSSQKL